MSSSMKILLFGAAGQVGTECALTLKKANYELVALTRADVDFAMPHRVAAAIELHNPDLVVNACAYTAVDKAEQQQAQADLVNHKSVLAMANACHQRSIPLIHLSTDYVFNGEGAAPYKEDDQVAPLGVYGATKLSGEIAIQNAMTQYIILRTSWVFGEYGNNFVKTMLLLGAERDVLSVVDDQIGRPTYAGDIVTTILFLVDCYKETKALPWGVYHCSSEGVVSWYGFAQAIFSEAVKHQVLTAQPRLSPIPTTAYPTPAPRPAYSVLDTHKLAQLMGAPLPCWQHGLVKLLKSILS